MDTMFFMMVGLPASGKTTYAKNLGQKYNAKIFSSDELREELFGDVNCQDKNDILFTELHNRIKRELVAENSVVYDACNINYKQRMNFLQQIKNINCYKSCVLIATPYNICIKQNSEREREIPEYVIERMYKNIYIPQYYEGWDDIDIIYHKKLEDKTYDNYKNEGKLFSLLNISQDNPYHTLTISEHCKKCYQLLSDKYVGLYLGGNTLLYAALYHDIGKFFTKQYNTKKKYYSYFQHQFVSAYETLFWAYNRYKYYYCNIWKDVLETTSFVQWHMQPFFMNTDETKQKFINLVGQNFYNRLMILHEADKLAK
jgi:predicted kinase